MAEFQLHYHVQNGGDGSANVQFHDNFSAAENACDEQEEGWGESSAGTVTLKIVDNKICREEVEYIKGKRTSFWKPLEEVE